MPRSKRAPSRERGVILVTVLVTLGVTAVVGISAGLVIIDQSAGCSDVMARLTANEPVTQQEMEGCASAFQKQMQLAGAAASFVPTGADDAIVTAPLSALVDRASQPGPGGDAPLPPDVTGALACGNGEKDPGEKCDVTARTIGCSGQTCVNCGCITVPSLPGCPATMPSYLGDWKLDPSKGDSHVASGGYPNQDLSAVCYYNPPAAAGLPSDGHIRFFAYALHSGLSKAFLKMTSCKSDTFRKDLDKIAAGNGIINTGEPDWFPISHTSETLVSSDRCAAVKVIYYPMGTGSGHRNWLWAHPRVVFEAHALAEQLFLKAEISAFARP